ncbi:hypothetical protein ACN28C_20170 [Plantactinospora sp. WMMC1484]|uniref:hypothetical protein n=1 Tax=Plantactinospora sp. WMMC1484 TaxID=3404122 RepID=UPI003BF5CFAC
MTMSNQEYRVGETVTVHLRRTNTHGSACMLSRVPAGAVTLLSLTRDGAAVQPSIGAARHYRSFPAYLVENLVSVPPGGSLDLALPSDPDTPTGPALATTATDGRGGALVTWWPVTEPGSYQITVGYLRPPLPGVPPDTCAAAMEQATATFSVRAG